MIGISFGSLEQVGWLMWPHNLMADYRSGPKTQKGWTDWCSISRG